MNQSIAEEESYRYTSRPWMGPPWESAAAERVRRAGEYRATLENAVVRLCAIERQLPEMAADVRWIRSRRFGDELDYVYKFEVDHCKRYPLSDLDQSIAEEESYRYTSRPWMGPPWESAAAERVRREQRATRTLVRAIETWAIFARAGVGKYLDRPPGIS